MGEIAPPFSLQTHDGTTHDLASHRGRRVVVYFYPADDTPTCTVQACDFRSQWKALQKAGIDVLGISPDDVESHQRFRRKYRLPFILLADPGHRVADAYGVWGEKQNYGRTYIGLHRTTFLVGPDGRVSHRFDRVRTKGHAARILAALGG